MIRIFPLCLLIVAAGLRLSAQSEVNLEATAWNTRLNEVRKPSVGGTSFSFAELLGNGPTWATRVDASWQLNPRHGLRVLLAPFEVSGTGTFASPVTYQGRVFRAGEPTRGLYRFNSWRATWRYTLREDQAWTVRLGAIPRPEGDPTGRGKRLGEGCQRARWHPPATTTAQRVPGPWTTRRKGRMADP